MKQWNVIQGQDLCQRDTGRLSSAEPAKRHAFLAAILLCALAAGIHDHHLRGRDEPREAEIAREMLLDGHWITPHLCGLPFLEKPPLYYAFAAAGYRLTGSISAPVARSVSALFSLVMLAAVFLLAYHWGGARSAGFSALLLLAMPQFFRYSHTILLDIAVGAFCTVALVAFVFRALWTPCSRGRGWLYLFYLAGAGAFLSKGLIGVFHILLIVGAFLLLRRRTALLKRLLAPGLLLTFLVPVAVWIYLYYREGGLPYLHEHFVNNTIGRFLQIHFTFPGANFYHTDLGNTPPWHFYLSSLPGIAGVALAILPFALWDEWKAIRALRRSPGARSRRDADLRVLLILWALLPPLCLSFSSVKETSYILPSYSAIAVLTGRWMDRRLAQEGFKGWRGAGWLAAVLPFAAMSLVASRMALLPYLLLTIGSLMAVAPVLAFLLYRKVFTAVAFLSLAVALDAAIIYNSPNVLLHRDGCYLAFGRQVWARVGGAPLFLYRPGEAIRGCIPFSRNRLAREISLPEQLRAVLSSKDRVFVLTRDFAYNSEPTASAIRDMDLQTTILDGDDLSGDVHRFVLISNRRG